MASDSGIDSQSSPEMAEDHPMSRTHQYRKVMKPMLERKRRARINKCLDELKDLMVGALQTEGESITKLEKADVLELTVRHLRKLKAHGALGLTPAATYAERFRAGYSLCASEVSKYVTSGAAGVDVTVSARLLHHLSQCIRNLETMPVSVLSFPHSPIHHSPTAILPSPLTPPESTLGFPSGRCLSEYLTPGKVEALRYSLSQSPISSQRPPSSSSSVSLSHVVRADIALVPTTDKDDDKAWRPW
eukprot:TRINITY_DN30025_c0_g1_i1.p1 TRINITY_DN30025_c0_g1~~TRINITY_DN30025_c0_g1_i1.p1  ORF type:complete len:246 (-),score=37.54 TRINITY_DN30025_c0_g1_i1:151-888(-)